MKIELPNYSNYLWRYGDVADSLSDSVQEHDDPVWNLIHSNLKTPSTSEINQQAVKQFVELATKAIHLSKHFTADLTIEIDERLRGIISFEMPDLYVDGKTPQNSKTELRALIEDANQLYIDASDNILCITLYYTLNEIGTEPNN